MLPLTVVSAMQTSLSIFLAILRCRVQLQYHLDLRKYRYECPQLQSTLSTSEAQLRTRIQAPQTEAFRTVPGLFQSCLDLALGILVVSVLDAALRRYVRSWTPAIWVYLISAPRLPR